MRCAIALLFAALPLVYGSPVDVQARWENSNGAFVLRGAHDGNEVDTVPILAHRGHEKHHVYMPRASASKGSKGSTCPATTKSKTSTKEKTTRWLSGLVRRNTDYGSLSVPTAAEPLDRWATAIYTQGTENKEVHVDFETDLKPKPTALFEKFADKEFYMTLTGLYGCTSVVVTSYCGAYIAHFWEAVMNDAQYRVDGNSFIAGAADALKNIQNKKAEAAANKNAQFKQAMAPDANFVSLEAHKACLSKDMGAKAFVFTTAKGVNDVRPKNPETTEALKEIIAELTGLTTSEILTHLYVSPGMAKARAKTNGEGKVLLTYSPNTKATNQEHAYQVHVKKTDTPGTTMALGDTWHGDANQCACPGLPLLVKKHNKSCCCAIQ